MNDLKLRIMIGTLEVGGAEIHLSQILPALAQKGWAIELIVLNNQLSLLEKFIHPNIEITFSKFTSPSKLPFFVKRFLRLFFVFFFLIKVLRKNTDVPLHFFLPESYVFGLIIAKLIRYKGQLLMSRRSLNYYQKRRPFLGKIERKIHKYCHLFMANSKAAQKQLIEEENVPKEKTVLLYNGIDENRFKIRDKAFHRQKLGYGEDQFIIVCVANLIPYKGHKDIINGLSRIKNDLPTKWKLLLIGKDCGIKHALEKDIQNLGLQNHIVFIEDCNEPAPFLLASDLGILASHEEGFSNALIEMMTASLPIIATNVGGNAEAIIHEKNGLLIKPHCPEDIATSILRLAKNEKLCQQFGKASYEMFAASYKLEKCVEFYDSFYRDILSNTKLTNINLDKYNLRSVGFP